jgi:predicted patatin/cPLA2 family phospholipase
LAVLALSGGGANGAFCAGLLGGWSEAGTRPEFQVVTGVSTGALAAPFAFLGPRYDDRLRTAYTQMRAHDIYHLHVMRSAFRLLRVDAVADTEPMTRTVARLTDQGMLDAIAAEHRRGRRLYVCTTELVSGRAVYWSLSAIAASGRPGSLELFQKLLVASSSIPVAFPPQYIGVEAGGRSYTEMHVDGGLSSQVFLDLQGARAELPATTARGPLALTAYIIRNAKVVPAYDSLRPELLAIASRSLQALIRRQGNGDLNRIYEQAGREDTVFRLAVIPADFPMEHRGAIDTAYMARLFELGRKMAARGYPWVDRPPAYDQGPVRSNGTEAVGVR